MTTTSRIKNLLELTQVVLFFCVLAAALLVMPLFLDLTLPNSDRVAHYRWIAQFSSAIEEGTAYPRWMPLPNSGFGELAYSPYLIYWYFTAFAALFDVEIWTAIKSAALISSVITATAAYLFARKWTSNINALIAGAILVFAPFPLFLFTHHAAYPWHFSLCLALVLTIASLNADKTIQSVFFIAVTTALLTLSHVLVAFMTILSLGPAVLYLRPGNWASKLRQTTLIWGVPILIGVGLVAFHLLPAISARALLDPQLTQDLRWVDWRNSFAFPVVTSAIHGTRWFSVQWLHASVILLSVIAALAGARSSDGAKLGLKRIVVGLAIASITALALSSELAYPLYNYVSPLRNVQWPYRFLSIASVTGIYALGLSLQFLNVQGSLSKILSVVAVVLLIAMSILLQQQVWREGEPVNFNGTLLVGDFSKSGNTFKTVGPSWKSYAKNGGMSALCKKNVAVCESRVKKSQYRQWSINNPNSIYLLLPAFDFPGWTVSVDGTKQLHGTDPATGLVGVTIPPGDHLVTLEFTGLPIATTGILISIFSLICLVMIYFFRGRTGIKNSKSSDAPLG